MPRRKQRPKGQPTRGKTARNRLRRVDTFLLLYDSALVRRVDPRAYFVDLGYGAEPFTTLESADRLGQINPALPVLGVEIDPERVANAAPYADKQTQFRLGGFNLPLLPGETARIIRAFNVLRQYDEADVIAAWQMLGRALLPGGLLIEGTSDPYGRVLTANLLRRAGDHLRYEGMLFGTNFRWGFAPGIFQPVLPKNCIHRMVPGEKIYALMSVWNESIRGTIAHREWGLRQWFIASARALAGQGYPLELRGTFLRRGYLLWKDSPGVPAYEL